MPLRHVSAADPSRHAASHVDVSERAAGSRGVIQPSAANEVRILVLHALDGGEDDTHVGEVHLAVVVQVVHPSIVVVVDDDVGSVTELVPAVTSAPALVAKRLVVVRRAETGDYLHSVGVDTVPLEILDDQLELVEERLLQNQLFRPDAFLVVRQEIAEQKMLGDAGVLVLACHFNEAIRILVGIGTKTSLLFRPEPNPVGAN